MNTKYIRNIMIAIGAFFVIAVIFGLMRQPGFNEEEVNAYLEDMSPVAQAHLEWKKDYNALTEIYDVLSPNQKLEQLDSLMERIEQIRLDIEDSQQPEALDYIKAKWEEECRSTVQGIYDIRLGLQTNNVEWITDGYELLTQANEAGQQWQNELLKVLNDNGLTLADAVYSSYFGS